MLCLRSGISYMPNSRISSVLRIVVDKFSSRKGLKEKITSDRMFTAKEIYEFLGGRDWEKVNEIMTRRLLS